MPLSRIFGRREDGPVLDIGSTFFGKRQIWTYGDDRTPNLEWKHRPLFEGRQNRLRLGLEGAAVASDGCFGRQKRRATEDAEFRGGRDRQAVSWNRVKDVNVNINLRRPRSDELFGEATQYIIMRVEAS